MMGDGWFVYMLVSVLCFLPSLQLLKLFWTNSVPWVRAHSAGRAAGSSAYHWHHWVPVWPGEYYLQVLVPCAAAADDDDVTGCLAAKQLVGQWEAVDAAVLVCLMPHSSLSTWTGPDGCSQRTIQAIALRVSSWGCKRDFWLAQKLHPQKEAVMPKHADLFIENQSWTGKWFNVFGSYHQGRSWMCERRGQGLWSNPSKLWGRPWKACAFSAAMLHFLFPTSLLFFVSLLSLAI